MTLEKITFLKIVLLRILSQKPANYPAPQDALVAEVSLLVLPRPTLSEVEGVLETLESLRLIVGVTNSLTGQRKWSITDAGRIELGSI